MDVNKLRHFKDLTLEKRALADKLKGLGETLRKLSAELVDDFVEDGMTKTTIDGLTIHLHNQTVTRVIDQDAATKFLARRKLTDICPRRVNHQSISAWVREREANGEPLPKGFEEHFKIERFAEMRLKAS